MDGLDLFYLAIIIEKRKDVKKIDRWFEGFQYLGTKKTQSLRVALE